jgi:hypothetical protein
MVNGIYDYFVGIVVALSWLLAAALVAISWRSTSIDKAYGMARNLTCINERKE